MLYKDKLSIEVMSEDNCLLGFDALGCGWSLPTFRANILPSSSLHTHSCILMMEENRSSERLITIYHITKRHVTQEVNRHSHRRRASNFEKLFRYVIRDTFLNRYTL
jgi:hypothetical protein